MSTIATQAQTPAANTRTINVLHYTSKDGAVHADPYTRFSELTKRQGQLLKEGIEVTVRPAQATIETKVNIVTVE